jgi:hypothetical protein
MEWPIKDTEWHHSRYRNEVQQEYHLISRLVVDQMTFAHNVGNMSSNDI